MLSFTLDVFYYSHHCCRVQTHREWLLSYKQNLKKDTPEINQPINLSNHDNYVCDTYMFTRSTDVVYE